MIGRKAGSGAMIASLFVLSSAHCLAASSAIAQHEGDGPNMKSGVFFSREADRPNISPARAEVNLDASARDGFTADVRSVLAKTGKTVRIAPALPGVATLIGQQPSLFSFYIHEATRPLALVKGVYYFPQLVNPLAPGASLPAFKLTFEETASDEQTSKLSYNIVGPLSQTREAGYILFADDCSKDIHVTLRLDGYPHVKSEVAPDGHGAYVFDCKSTLTQSVYYSIFANRSEFYKDLERRLHEQVTEIRKNKKISDLVAEISTQAQSEKSRRIARWLLDNIAFLPNADFYPKAAQDALFNNQTDEKGLAVLMVAISRLAGLDVSIVLASTYSSNLEFGGFSMPLNADHWLAYDRGSSRFFDFSLLNRKDANTFEGVLNKWGEIVSPDGQYAPILIASEKMFDF